MTANQHSTAVDEFPFLAFEDPYNCGWDDDLGAVPAKTVTDVAI